jgi:transposase
VPRHELTDEQWAIFKPLLPLEKPPTGRPATNHRRCVNAIVWLCRTGAPWRDLPTEYGPWQTAATQFYRWQKNDTWREAFIKLREMADAEGRIDWDMHCVDSTVIRAHQHAAGGRTGVPRALGRSRGGFGSKIHIRTDGSGNPLAFCVTGGEEHDAPQLLRLVDMGGIKRVGRGRPRLRPTHLAGDKGYDSDAIRAGLRERGIVPIIPPRRNRKRLIAYDLERYRGRNAVERYFNRIKHWRRVATRYEKHAMNYGAMIFVAVSMHFINLLL